MDEACCEGGETGDCFSGNSAFPLEGILPAIFPVCCVCNAVHETFHFHASSK